VLTHHCYFEDKVQSLGFERNGRKTSVGVLDVGEYHFGTAAAERMSIISGSVSVRLDGTAVTRDYAAGTCFEVPANSGFDIHTVDGPVAYLCEYL
jgi:uncharacterized protein YaiE (UPF0345 family)